MSANGTATSVYGFTGEQTDGTGLVFLRARYYAPGQGRFVTDDPWQGNPNLPMSYNDWLYVYGNPVNLTDPQGLCAKGTCGPDVTEWFMGEMQQHYMYGLLMRGERTIMHLSAQIRINSRPPGTPPPFLFEIAGVDPFHTIVREFTIPTTNLPIGSFPLLNSRMGYEAVELLGFVEYGLYGLAVDYSNLNYTTTEPTCNTPGCQRVGAKSHQTASLCGHCIDASDMGNMMFGFGGAARGYGLPTTYSSAAMYNVLRDKEWRDNGVEGLVRAYLSHDGRGAIPGWMIGSTFAFLNRDAFCLLINSFRPIGYNEAADETQSCKTCSAKKVINSEEKFSSSLFRMSNKRSTISELKGYFKVDPFVKTQFGSKLR